MPWHGVNMSIDEESCQEAVQDCKCPFCNGELKEVTGHVQVFQCPQKCGGILIPKTVKAVNG